MKLLQLRQFVTLAETLNFHRAAARLNMAQPPLSVSIRKLEEELGAALFVRESRGVRLTKAGEAALAHARQALSQAQRVQQAVSEVVRGERGRIRIGFVGSATYELLPRLLPAFHAAYPDVEIKLEESRTSDLLAAVEIGSCDVGIVRTPILTPGFRAVRAIDTDRLVVAVAKNSRFAGRASLQLAELSEEPFVIYAPTAVPSMHAISMLVCQEAGFVPKVAEEAAQLQTIICLVESGLGVALVPGVVSRHVSAVEFCEIKDRLQAATIGLGIVTAPEDSNPAAQRFQSFALERMTI